LLHFKQVLKLSDLLKAVVVNLLPSIELSSKLLQGVNQLLTILRLLSAERALDLIDQPLSRVFERSGIRTLRKTFPELDSLAPESEAEYKSIVFEKVDEDL
jgi:hypothetical protein